MMKDANEQALVARIRTLNPSVFPTQSRVTARYAELLKGNPAYLSPTPVTTLEQKDVVHGEVTAKEIELWVTFLQQNYDDGMDFEDDLLEQTFYSKTRVNGVDVRTAVSETRIRTRDSIVCGRYDVDEEPVFFLGEVRHIVSYRDTVLFCVEWFDSENIYGQDERLNGLQMIPVCIAAAQDQMWIDVGSLIIQQHIVVRPNPSSDSFHVFIRA